MILETVVLHTDWLKSDVSGVNQLLPEIPRYGSHREPPQIKVVGDVRDAWVIKQETPPALPALMVFPDELFRADGSVFTQNRDADDVRIAVRYVTGVRDLSVGVLDTMYTLRAVVQSLRQFNLNATLAAGDRELNNIVLRYMTNIYWGLIVEDLGDAVVSGAVVAAWTVRDEAP